MNILAADGACAILTRCGETPCPRARRANTKQANPQSAEFPLHDTFNPCLNWEKLKQTCKSLGKPLLMGEFGLPTSNPKSVTEVADYLKQHAQRVLNMGFQGYLMWHFDCFEDKTFHNAREKADEILYALRNLSPHS